MCKESTSLQFFNSISRSKTANDDSKHRRSDWKKKRIKNAQLGKGSDEPDGLDVVETWGGGQQADGAQGHELAAGGREGEARAGRAQQGQLEADAAEEHGSLASGSWARASDARRTRARG